MPNHVHLVLVPPSRQALAGAIGEAHRQYSRMINFREGWRGHLWQGRFASSLMDEAHLLSAVRYVELNPVRAGLVQSPAEWRWSSAAAHLAGRDDELVTVKAMTDRIGDWQGYLDAGLSEEEAERIRYGERTGRPLGSDSFVKNLEKALGRRLRPHKRGRKPKKSTEVRE